MHFGFHQKRKVQNVSKINGICTDKGSENAATLRLLFNDEEVGHAICCAHSLHNAKTHQKILKILNDPYFQEQVALFCGIGEMMILYHYVGLKQKPIFLIPKAKLFNGTQYFR